MPCLSMYFLAVITINTVSRGKGVSVKMLNICRHLMITVIGLALAASLVTSTVAAQETEDSQLFLAGFNAYQQRDYNVAVTRLNEVLQRHPETPLRDMTLFWLARSYYKSGNQQEAARYLVQFSREYPDNPLKNTVEDELQVLAAKYAAAKGPELAKADVASRQKQEQERLALEQAERERIAREKAALELTAKNDATAKAAAEKTAAEELESKRLAALKESELLKAKEKQEAERIAAEKAEAAKKQLAADAQTRKAGELKKTEQVKTDRAAMREKAIAEYKSIIERFPGTKAAQTASQRLKALGVTVAVAKPAQPVVAVSSPEPEIAENAQTLTIEVAQYAAFEFTAQSATLPVEVARSIQIPFEITNHGNGRDSFFLASGFPAEFSVRFAAAGSPDQAINQTPLLAPGEKFKGLIQLSIPSTAIDGLKIVYPVKAASQFMSEASQSREVALVAASPLLRAVVKTDKAQVAPGEKVQYKVAMLNVGSTTAQDVTLRLSFPAQYELVDSADPGFRKEMNAALVKDGISLKSGESREFAFTFQLKESALAREELVVRADLLSVPLQTRGAFISNAAFVTPLSSMVVKLATGRTVAIPGQVVTIPATVTNTGNQREKFNVAATVPASQRVTVYLDQNRDGLRQASEPAVTSVGPLGPKEEAALIVEIATAANAQDGSEAAVNLTVAPEAGQIRPVVAESRLVYARPVVQLAMKGRDGRMVPGELVIIDLAITNRGSNMAKAVELKAFWPQQMELVTAEPAAVKAVPGSSVWSFNELGAGEKRVVKVSFRVRPDTGVGTGLQLKSVLSYQDQMGNRY